MQKNYINNNISYHHLNNNYVVAFICQNLVRVFQIYHYHFHLINEEIEGKRVLTPVNGRIRFGTQACLIARLILSYLGPNPATSAWRLQAQ